MSEATKPFSEAAKAKDAEMKAYLDASIKAPEGMTGSQAYQATMEKLQNSQQQGDWMKIQDQVRDSVAKDVDAAYS